MYTTIPMFAAENVESRKAVSPNPTMETLVDERIAIFSSSHCTGEMYREYILFFLVKSKIYKNSIVKEQPWKKTVFSRTITSFMHVAYLHDIMDHKLGI